MHPLIESVAESLGAVVPAEPIEIRGSWSRSTRRTYQDAAQAGTGTGPFVEVVDLRWSGIADCTEPVAGIAFLHTPTSLYWVKSAPASARLDVEIGLHAYADRMPGRATFSAGFGRAWLPGVAVRCGPDPVAACAMGADHTATGRAHGVAQIDGNAFVVVLIPGALLQTGRNRLWRLRDESAVDLPADVRVLLTRGRSGEIR